MVSSSGPEGSRCEYLSQMSPCLVWSAIHLSWSRDRYQCSPVWSKEAAPNIASSNVARDYYTDSPRLLSVWLYNGAKVICWPCGLIWPCKHKVPCSIPCNVKDVSLLGEKNWMVCSPRVTGRSFDLTLLSPAKLPATPQIWDTTIQL